MTVPPIPNQDRVVDYTPMSSTADFTVPWPVVADSETAAKSDLTVIVNGVTLSVGAYTFAGTVIPGVAGMWNGGTVTLNTPVSGVRVIIASARAPRRTGNYLEGKPLPFSTLDKLMDDFAIQLRDMDLNQRRALKMSVANLIDHGEVDVDGPAIAAMPGQIADILTRIGMSDLPAVPTVLSAPTVGVAKIMFAAPVDVDDGTTMFLGGYDTIYDGYQGLFVYTAADSTDYGTYEALGFTDNVGRKWKRQFTGDYRLDWWRPPSDGMTPAQDVISAVAVELTAGTVRVTNGRNYALTGSALWQNRDGLNLMADSFGVYGGGNPPIFDWQGDDAGVLFKIYNCIGCAFDGLHLNVNNADTGFQVGTGPGGTFISSADILRNLTIYNNNSRSTFVAIDIDYDGSNNNEFMRCIDNYIGSFTGVASAEGVGIRQTTGNFNSHYHYLFHNNLFGLAQGISSVVGGLEMDYNNFTNNKIDFYLAGGIWPVIDRFPDSEISYQHAVLNGGLNYQCMSGRLALLGDVNKGWFEVGNFGGAILLEYNQLDNSSAISTSYVFDVTMTNGNTPIKLHSNSVYDPTRYVIGYSDDWFDFGGAWFEADSDPFTAALTPPFLSRMGQVVVNAQRSSMTMTRSGIFSTAVEFSPQISGGNLTITHGISPIDGGSTISRIAFKDGVSHGNLTGPLFSGLYGFIAKGAVDFVTGDNIAGNLSLTTDQAVVMIYDGVKFYPTR